MSIETLFYGLSFCSLCISGTLFVLLIFIRAPKKQALTSYRNTRIGLIFSFFMVTCLSLVLLYNEFTPTIERLLLSLNTLSISSFQLFVFSGTLIIMLDYRAYSIRRALVEIILTFSFSVIGFLFFIFHEWTLLHYFFWFFGSFYVIQIIRYTLYFSKIKKRTVSKLDNFFSEETATRLKWTGRVYVWLLIGSIIAFLSLFMDMRFYLFFAVFYTSFYLYFSIHYLNYVTLFLDMESAFNIADDTQNKDKFSNKSFDQLKKAIEEWERKKYFVEPGITIEQVATQLQSNRTYVSTHMNLHRKMTFKEWINTLRIEEAKCMLQSHPDLPVSQIGAMVGLPDKSNFGRQFTRLTGKSPQAWRKDQ